MHFRTQKFHAEDVESLAFRIFFSHKNFAFQPEQCSGRGCGHPVLAGAGFGNDALFAHPFGQEHLPENIVDFVGTGMVQILPLQIDFRPAQIFRHFFRIIEKRRASCVLFQQSVQFGDKFRVIFKTFIRFFQFVDRVHQRLGNILPAVNTESSFTHGDHLLLFLNCFFKTEKNRQHTFETGGNRSNCNRREPAVLKLFEKNPKANGETFPLSGK